MGIGARLEGERERREREPSILIVPFSIDRRLEEHAALEEEERMALLPCLPFTSRFRRGIGEFWSFLYLMEHILDMLYLDVGKKERKTEVKTLKAACDCRGLFSPF